MRAAGLRIVERAIPTYYGSEVCHVKGLRYAKDVVKSVLEYELHELGLMHHAEYDVEPSYTMKRSAWSSHAQRLDLVGSTPRRVLDIGCGSGEFGHLLRSHGHYVVGVDRVEPRFQRDEFLLADLEQGLPIASGRRFDMITLADVLEHLTDPTRLLSAATAHLTPAGRLLVSLPNAVHWSVRAQIARGKFGYTNKGLLDRGHVRFFTRNTAKRLFEDEGLRVLSTRATPVPWENVFPPLFGGFLRDTVERADHFLTRLRPNVFAYQHLFELSRR